LFGEKFGFDGLILESYFTAHTPTPPPPPPSESSLPVSDYELIKKLRLFVRLTFILCDSKNQKKVEEKTANQVVSNL